MRTSDASGSGFVSFFIGIAVALWDSHRQFKKVGGIFAEYELHHLQTAQQPVINCSVQGRPKSERESRP